MWVAFALKATHIFSSKIIGIYAKFNDLSFNNTLTCYVVSFEQLALYNWNPESKLAAKRDVHNARTET